jgi:hypothetical protein
MGEWIAAAEEALAMAHWMGTEKGKAWTRYWLDSEAHADHRKANLYSLLYRAEPHKLLSADPIWVSSDMCELIDVAREDFPPETIEREDFLVHTGFVYFARCLHMLDRNHRQVSVRAMSWCPVMFRPGDLYEVRRSEADEVAPDDHGTVIVIPMEDGYAGNEWGIGITLFSSTSDEGDDFHKIHQQMRREWGAGELLALHLTAVEFGSPLDAGHMVDEEGHYTGADQWWKLVQTTLRLMQQRIAIRVDTRLPRAARRRAERQGRGIEEVLVIRLRRESGDRREPSGESANYSHRFLRDGHWRNHYFPSLKRHRRIRIQPTIVGDPSLPLVIKKRFYKWDR